MALENVRCLIASGQNLKAFNENNRWKSIGILENITPELFTSAGTPYPTLTQSLDHIKLLFSQIDTLEDGSIVYQSEEITQSMGVTGLEAINENDTDKLKAIVPVYIPKDQILETDKIYCYTTDTAFKPYVNGISFNKTSTHNEAVGFTLDIVYNYNEKIKYRVKVNNKEFSDWSAELDPFEKIKGEIPPSSLMLGQNTLTFEIANFDNSKVTEHIVENAITVVNDTPEIMIISADSDAFKLHFKIVDNNAQDNISYKLSITNTKFKNEILEDWSSPVSGIVDHVYYIDTSKVVVGDTNVIAIEYKDQYMDSPVKATYVFQGQYKNIVFIDEDGEYYTSDKGVILKIMDLDTIVAGQESTIRKVVLRNNNTVPITNLRLETIYRQSVKEAKLLYSKSNNPFVALESLNYGQEVFQPNQDVVFYVKLDTTIASEGVCKFDVNATADPESAGIKRY